MTRRFKKIHKAGGKMSTGFEDLGFEVVHIGVNCEDDLEAGKTAEFLQSFCFPFKRR